jgi:hypothetical protein
MKEWSEGDGREVIKTVSSSRRSDKPYVWREHKLLRRYYIPTPNFILLYVNQIRKGPCIIKTLKLFKISSLSLLLDMSLSICMLTY